MPFINMGDNFDDVGELQIVPEAEYDLRCSAADHTPWDPINKKSNVRLTIEVQNPPEGMKATEVNKIMHWIGIPHPEDDDEKRENKQRMSKRVCALFGVECTAGGFDPDHFVGKTVRAGITVEIPEDGPMKGIKQNRLMVPRMSDEAAGEKTKSGRRRA